MGLLKKIDCGISITLRNEKLSTRANASPGTWTIFLLPISIILTGLTWPISSVYKYCVCYAANLLMNSILLLVHMKYYGTLSITKSLNFYTFIPAILAITLYRFVDLDLYRAVCYSISNTLLYFEALPYILKVFPKSFSFGEACIVSQGIALFIFGSFIRLNDVLLTTPLSGDLEIATTILQVTLFLVLLVCLIPKTWSTSQQYIAAFVGLICVVPILNVFLGFNGIYWALELIFTGSRLRLICGWAVCSGFAWGSVVIQVKSQRKAATDTRKIFHFLAVAVFLSGILTEPVLLYFAAGLIFPLFLLIEFVRLRKLPPFAEALQNGFTVYADEKDAGGVALTPIYLLLGCSMPMWLLPYVSEPACRLPLISGVLSIGIGDSCASIIGKHFGKHKWSGSRKTIEGTVACVVGQMTTLLILTSLDYLPLEANNIFHLIKPLLAVLIASIIEAKTDQIDNLVLPLVTYILLIA